MLHFNYYKKANFLETKILGDIDISDIEKHYRYISSICKKHKILRVLIDCRKCRINVQPNDLDQLKPLLLDLTNKLVYLREAILVDLPQSTVIATIFEDKYEGIPNYSFKVFSTEEAATLWLNGSKNINLLRKGKYKWA